MMSVAPNLTYRDFITFSMIINAIGNRSCQKSKKFASGNQIEVTTVNFTHILAIIHL